MPFNKIPYLGTTVAAIEQFERAIRGGELKPGERLPPEREIAQMLGVSRPTAREALQALTLLGILERRRGSGTFVTSLDHAGIADTLGWLMSMAVADNDAVQVLDARATLESGLARLAAERISDEALTRLQELQAALNDAKSPTAILQIDMSMHTIVAEQAHNPLLHLMLNSLRRWEATTRVRTIAVSRIRDEVARDQGDITAALIARDPQQAEAAMLRHILRIRDEYRAAESPETSELPT